MSIFNLILVIGLILVSYYVIERFLDREKPSTPPLTDGVDDCFDFTATVEDEVDNTQNVEIKIKKEEGNIK